MVAVNSYQLSELSSRSLVPQGVEITLMDVVRAMECVASHPVASQAIQAAEETATAQVDSDSYLLELVRQGDQNAMAALYDRYSRTVYQTSLRILRDQSAAEDIVQEVFMMIWRRPEVLSASAHSFTGWMLTVARNRCYDQLRGRRRRAEEPIEDVVLPSLKDHSRVLEYGLMGEQAARIISELPEPMRRVIEMAFFRDMTHLEIASHTGLPLGTVKSKIRIGLLRVRDELSSSAAPSMAC